MSDDIGDPIKWTEALSFHDAFDATVGEKAAAEITRLRAEVARCHARLEIDHVFVMGDGGDMIPKDIPEDDRPSVPDGIDSRNATIRGLGERCDRLRALNAELVEALKWALAEINGSTRYKDDVQRERCLFAANAALAKAEGREP